MDPKISIRLGEKTYSGCSVDDAGGWKIRLVCVERKRLWRSSQAAFERSVWELSSRDGGRVYLGDLELVFPSEDDACAFIAKILSMTYDRSLEEARKAAADYLRKRSEILDTTSRLRRSPRSVLISEAESLKDCQGDPLECLLERLRGKALSIYGEFAAVLEGAIAPLPPAEAERVRSAVYLVASLQSKIYERDLSSISKILDLVEAMHGYIADRTAIEKIAYRQELKSVEEMCIDILNRIFKSVASTVYLKYRCREL